VRDAEFQLSFGQPPRSTILLVERISSSAPLLHTDSIWIYASVSMFGGGGSGIRVDRLLQAFSHSLEVSYFFSTLFALSHVLDRILIQKLPDLVRFLQLLRSPFPETVVYRKSKEVPSSAGRRRRRGQISR
jgi:hypothetical protein